MVITYHGGESIKISFGDTTLAFNPVSKESKLKTGRFGADVVFVSINHPDMNGIEQVAGNGKDVFVVEGPGEYEMKSVFAKGFKTQSHYGGEARINTVYAIRLEGMNILYLGAHTNDGGAFDSSIIEDMDSVDVLIMPIGGDGVLTPADAQKIAVTTEAKVVVPMHFIDMGEKDALKTYLKESGAESVTPVEKLTLKKKDVDQMSGEVAVLAVK